MDGERHEEITGVPNDTILDNLIALGGVHNNIWIRIPVIPGMNDSVANMQSTADFVSRIQGVRRINLLPFHAAGTKKSRRMGRMNLITGSNNLNGVKPPSREKLEALAECFRTTKLQTTIAD